MGMDTHLARYYAEEPGSLSDCAAMYGRMEEQLC